MAQLVTRRLILRQPRIDDAAAISRALTSYDVSKWLGVVPHPYVAWHARKFLELAAIAEGTGGDIPRVIVLKANPRHCIGVIGLRRNANLTVSLGYWIAQPFQGRGLASEAARALVDFGFSSRIVDAVIATALVDNIASHRVLTAVGLVPQTRREHLYVRARHRKLPVRTYRLDRATWEAAIRPHPADPPAV